MGRAKSGSGVLIGLLVIGVFGYVAVQQLGLPTISRENLPSSPPGGASVTTDSAADALSERTSGGIPARPSDALAMTVEYVHDGDTLFLRTDEPNALGATTDAVKVRLLGIDTPEVGDGAECFGDEATEQLRTLLPDGSRTWITADQDPEDQYGRSLFYLWTEDGRFVNYELVAGGAAESLMIAPNDAHYPVLREAEVAAATAGAGRWGAC
ncbi:MAG: thermonuclease family protein [Cryobacterium sp.]|nr:thermonuclease family protein [Cryobacterium sp.]